MPRHSALFSASLAVHAAGITWHDITDRAIYLEEITTRVAIAIAENAEAEVIEALTIVTGADTEAVLFYLDQFEEVGAE